MRSETRGLPENVVASFDAHHEIETFNSRDLLESLKPEVVEDEDGIQHTIFTFHNKRGKPVRVLFYGREETPMMPAALEGRQAFVFGDEPKWRPKKDWENFAKNIREHSFSGQDALNPGVLRADDVDQGNSLFFVEQNPRALLDMAIVLGADDAELRDLRYLAAQGETNDRLEQIVDQVIATKMLNNEGAPKVASDNEGEALLILALSGNTKARKILEQKRQKLVALDNARDRQQLEANTGVVEKIKEEPLDPKELVAVHLTNYMPRTSGDGKNLELQTTYEATGKKIPRITQHFTMNHPVESAGLYGSWYDTPIAILMPFDKIVAQNGKPTALNTVDTFWERSPGRKMRCSKDDAVLVKPGEVKEAGKLFETHGNEVVYKDRGIGPEDIKAVAEALGQDADRELNKDILKSCQAAFTEYSIERNGVVPRIDADDFDRLAQVFGNTPGEHPQFAFSAQLGKKRDLLPELMKKKIHTVIEELLDEAGIRERVPETIVSEVVKQIEGKIICRIKKFAIEQKIQDMGYEVHGGGQWAWDGDSWEATARTRKLGLEMGVPVLPHFVHDSAKLEKVLFDEFAYLKEEKKGPKAYHDAVHRLTRPEEAMAKSSPPMRRMLYEIGAF